jgi:hypothetical protein
MSLSGRSLNVDTAAKAEWAGRLLVILQFGLLALMGWRAKVSPFSLDILAVSLLSGSASAADQSRKTVSDRLGNDRLSGGRLPLAAIPYRTVVRVVIS